MTKWKEDFKKEFGIHFKDSSGELGFAIAFIEDELKNQIPDEAASADAINLDDLDDKMKDYESGLVEGWNACRDKMLRSLKDE